MTRLTLQLLGPLAAFRSDCEPVSFAYDKVRALCGYLAAASDAPHPRGRLAAMFWPEKPESAARHSLSQALSSLRSSFGERQGQPAIICSDRQLIWLDLDAGCSVDLRQFRELIQPDAGTERSLEHMRKAIELYRGPFLDGLSLDDCPEFEDWHRTTRESIERSYATALKSLIRQLEQLGEFSEATEYGNRLIELDPWDEECHRLQMHLLAASGNRALAIRQYETCVETLRRDLDLDPEPQTEALAQRIRAGLEGQPVSSRPPVVLASPESPQLPVPATPLVGREWELEELADQLLGDENRLVTLIGPGGIGKSRLAIEVAHSLRERLNGEVYFVSLAGAQAADHIAPAILDATSAQVDPQSDHNEQLIAFLKSRELLLVLDNFEHLLDGALLLSEVLDAAPGVTILVTSRQRLLLSSESVFQVEGLGLPEGTDLPALARSGAARLFMLRARKHQAAFLPRVEDAAAVARIAQLTGGMPLAIELAAAWVPILTPLEIAAEIEQSLDFLSAEMRDLPERHRSVRAVIDRSWENLTEVEQRGLRRLSVFAGGFTRNSASYVAGAALPVLSALVSKSLVRHTSAGRYEIHELIRQYAEDRLSELPQESAIVRERFRDHFIGFIAVREEQLRGRAQERVLSEIAREMDNLRNAWWEAVRVKSAFDLSRAAHSLWLYFDITDRYSEGATMMRAACEALQEELGKPSKVIEYETRFAIARLLSREAALSFRVRGPGLIQQQVSDALEIVADLDEPAETGLLLNFLACAAHASGQHQEEEEFLLRSIESFVCAGDDWGVAYSRNDLGQLRTLQGRFREARDLHQDALETLYELGDRRGIAFAYRNLGIAESRLGNIDLGIELLHRSVEIRRPIGNQWGTAESLKQIGVILRDSGFTQEAEDHFREALQIARDINAMQLASEIISAYLPIVDSSGTRPEQLRSSVPMLTGKTFERVCLNVSAVEQLADSLLEEADIRAAPTESE